MLYTLGAMDLVEFYSKYFCSFVDADKSNWLCGSGSDPSVPRILSTRIQILPKLADPKWCWCRSDLIRILRSPTPHDAPETGTNSQTNGCADFNTTPYPLAVNLEAHFCIFHIGNTSFYDPTMMPHPPGQPRATKSTRTCRWAGTTKQHLAL